MEQNAYQKCKKKKERKKRKRKKKVKTVKKCAYMMNVLG